ncbi:MAG: ATP-grasp domain-containing protein [Lachnospiraceae bacterium]|nr:ATP-grasp domain-containing protein [Lachnospiraceae bacterium]
MKKILIVGAGFLQVPLIKKAKECGLYTIAVDGDQNAPGFFYADEWECIDITDETQCLEYAKEKEINGVITAATDYGILTVARIAETMNLPGISYEIAKTVKNKYLIRKKISQNKELQFFELDTEEKALQLREQIRYPVIVKPCDGSGSKGVEKVENRDGLLEAFQEAYRFSKSKKVLVEDFFVGKEYGADIFVHDGMVEVMALLGKHITPEPDYAELGHYYPSGLKNEKEIKEKLRQAVESLGITHGAVNMDYLVNGEEIFIVDLGARMGGNIIYSHIIPEATGRDYAKEMIMQAVGESTNHQPFHKNMAVATRLLALTPGVIEKLPDFSHIEAKYGVEIFHHLKVGDTIHKYHTNLDGGGYILATDEVLEYAEKKAENALREIDDSILRR